MNTLLDNLATPGFIDNYIYSNIDQFCSDCIGVAVFLCMICLFGRKNYLNKKRAILFYLPTIGSIILMSFEACFCRFTITFSEWDYIESVIYSYGSEVYYLVLGFCFYKEKRFRRVIEMVLTRYMLAVWVFNNVKLVLMTNSPVYLLYWAGEIDLSELIARSQLALIPADTCCFIVIVLLLYFGLYRKGVCIGIRMRYFVSIMAFWNYAIQCFSTRYLVLNVDAPTEETRFWGGFLISLITLSLPLVMILINHRKILTEKNKAQEEYLESQLKYIEQYKMSQEKTRKFRHDILNQLSFMQYLLKDDKEKEVKQQLEELLGQINALSPKYVTGDEMLDCIVAMKADKMETQGIDFTMDGIIDGGLPMKPMEICTIFANVLDNAIEATRKIEDEEKKWVTMSMKKTEQFWVINISNATKEKPDLEKMSRGEGYTSKPDSRHHGIGIRNIRKTVEKREGIMKLDGDDDRFSLTVMLPRAS